MKDNKKKKPSCVTTEYPKKQENSTSAFCFDCFFFLNGEVFCFLFFFIDVINVYYSQLWVINATSKATFLPITASDRTDHGHLFGFQQQHRPQTSTWLHGLTCTTDINMISDRSRNVRFYISPTKIYIKMCVIASRA